MTFILKGVVAWGRSYQEYRDMFNLTCLPSDQYILGVGDGPASFNVIMTRKGHRVISCDPLYTLSQENLGSRISAARTEVMEQVCANQDNFIWDYFKDPASLEESRVKGMDLFMEDYPLGQMEGRYIPAKLPFLPFQEKTFHIALCSHLLFLYASLGYSFHRDALMEMLRVADEVRVYPVVDVNCFVPSFRDHLIQYLKEKGYVCALESVTYNFIKNGDQMLRILHVKNSQK